MNDSTFATVLLLFVILSCIFTILFSIINIVDLNNKIIEKDKTIEVLQSQDVKCFNYYFAQELPVCSTKD